MKKSQICKGIGIGCLCFSIALTCYNYYEDYHSYLLSLQIKDELYNDIDIQDDLQNENQDRPMPTILIDGHYYIGILEIPSLQLSLPINEQWSYDYLKISPCCYYGSFYKNNMVIAGHNYSRHFNKIKKLRSGSEVYFIDVEGYQYHYQVMNIEVLEENENEYLIQENDEWDLSLFTCNYNGEKRVVLRCKKIEAYRNK